MKQIEEIEKMIALIKEVKSCIVKKDKLSDKAFNLSPRNATPSQIDKATSSLNWSCMELDKAITNFARQFKGSLLDVSTEEKEYNPSSFHKYKH